MPQSSEQQIEERVAALEERLRQQSGLPRPNIEHFRRPVERPFTADQRSTTTILFGGMTADHDYIVKAALEGLGYRAEQLPVPDNDALALGKEFCNRGQCNPTYYTVGTLVRHLQALRASGVAGIEDRYVFVTLGACGPCRFGMYESEYRKALNDAGFPRFRVIIVQKGGAVLEGGGLGAAAVEGGIKLDARFYFTLMRAVVASDILKSLGYSIRPYECQPGATDAALKQSFEVLACSFREHTSGWRALRRVRSLLDEVEVDFTRVKPKVKMTGEFWALTTEGDGSYRLQSWLESEGAEVVPEPASTWVEYMLEMAVLRLRDRRGIARRAGRRVAVLRTGGLVFRLLCTTYRAALDFRTPPLVSQAELMDAAADYYNPRLGGGEGHMEVGKHILTTTRKKAHMVVSIKPFGCMPSTQSDGVQTKVVARLKDSIFIPVETSGDGEINVKSRVQMKLFEAKVRAREELQVALEEHGLTLEEFQGYVANHPHLRRPMLQLPHRYAGTASNLVGRVAQDMGRRSRPAPPAAS